MRYKMFGQRTGLRVSEIALGAGMFGTTSGYGAPPDEVHRILRSFADAGGNFIDTADNYQLGESERLIGEFIAPHRDAFVLATKYSRGATASPALTALGANRKVMVQSVEASLKRLKTDRIDLYFVHMDDGVTPVDEIARGLDDLVRAGKIVYAGLSNFSAWRVAAAARTADLRGWASIAAVQLEYSLLQRTPERELLPMASAFGLGIMGWSPLGGGLLTGKYRKGEKGRATDLKASVLHDTPAQDAVLDVLLAVAAEIGASPGQVAIAWVRAKGILPVIGPRTHAQLDDNLAATRLTLADDHLRRLDAASAVSLGYPHELLGTAEQRAVMTGNRWDQIDHPDRPVA
ncbi:aldo/keto reductase [Chondromyces apiculatus]|uniref:Aldo/keto reductase n=1 Tax=Chondromyces apiculatus DSM 436 TaxID=1192034 RepID=A0A017T5Y6_9BACT|nr:aldo/keto reductase [Chondromyces apiculatus]EYF04437.1 Aldo/keto reductase [Chondromyces apiculatus DSM 436]